MNRPVLGAGQGYAALSASWVFADSDRGAEDGYGGSLVLGRKVSDRVSVELAGTYASLDPTAGTGNSLRLTGGGLFALVYPSRTFRNVFWLGGVQYLSATDHPGPVPEFDSIALDTGIGFLYALGDRFVVRADARFRMDNHDEQGAGTTATRDRSFYDGVLNLGVLIPFGEKPVPAPALAAGESPFRRGVPGGAPARDAKAPAGAIPDASVVDGPIRLAAAEPDTASDAVVDGAYVDEAPAEPPPTPPAPVPPAPGAQDYDPNADPDGDGVRAELDECPSTPPDSGDVLPDGCLPNNDCRKPRPGEQVDESGCAIEQVFVLHGVKYEFDSDRLTADAKVLLENVASIMTRYKELKFELHGHTCWMGTEEYNRDLSDRRAHSAMRFLVEHGIQADRMKAIGHGESMPIDTNQTRAGREYNRRVELKITGTR